MFRTPSEKFSVSLIRGRFNSGRKLRFRKDVFIGCSQLADTVSWGHRFTPSFPPPNRPSAHGRCTRPNFRSSRSSKMIRRISAFLFAITFVVVFASFSVHSQYQRKTLI